MPVLTSGLGAAGGVLTSELGGGFSAATVSIPGPSAALGVSYGGTYHSSDDAFRRRRKRKREDDLPYSKDPELQAARRELRRLAFYLHPDRTLELDDKTRAEYERLLKLATIEYHGQIERVKRRLKQGTRFDALRKQLREVTARLETLELQVVNLRTKQHALELEVKTLRGALESPPRVKTERKWAFPLFLGTLLGVIATLLVQAFRSSQATRKTRRRKPQRVPRRQAAKSSRPRRRQRRSRSAAPGART